MPGVCLRLRRHSDRIREFRIIDFHNLGIKDDIISTVIFIKIFSSDLIDIDRIEHCDCIEVFIDNCASSDFIFRTVNDPLHKFFSGYKGVLRQSANSLAGFLEVLGKDFFCFAFSDDKPYCKFAVKCSREGQIACDRLTTVVFDLSNKPALERLAFDNRL